MINKIRWWLTKALWPKARVDFMGKSIKERREYLHKKGYVIYEIGNLFSRRYMCAKRSDGHLIVEPLDDAFKKAATKVLDDYIRYGI